MSDGHLEYLWAGKWRLSWLDFDRYMRDWLHGDLMGSPYRWVGGGRAVYLPQSHGR